MVRKTDREKTNDGGDALVNSEALRKPGYLSPSNPLKQGMGRHGSFYLKRKFIRGLRARQKFYIRMNAQAAYQGMEKRAQKGGDARREFQTLKNRGFYRR